MPKAYLIYFEMFNRPVAQISKILPDFGEVLAIDGKGIETHAKACKKDGRISPDGRRDIDADDGTLWEKVKIWFGFKLHLVIDVTYELPVALNLTKASGAEISQAHKLLDEMVATQPEIIKECKVFLRTGAIMTAN